MKYRFSSSDYTLINGTAPRGRGRWAFIIHNAELNEIASKTYIREHSGPRGDRTDTVFWVSGYKTLTEAKKEASLLLEAAGVPAMTTIYVAP